MSEHPHQEAVDKKLAEADRLEERGEEIDEHIDETREDWEAKKHDKKVPGTPIVPAEPDEGEDTTEERQGPESASAKA
jgi:hypothetical protein